MMRLFAFTAGQADTVSPGVQVGDAARMVGL